MSRNSYCSDSDSSDSDTSDSDSSVSDTSNKQFFFFLFPFISSRTESGFCSLNVPRGPI